LNIFPFLFLFLLPTCLTYSNLHSVKKYFGLVGLALWKFLIIIILFIHLLIYIILIYSFILFIYLYLFYHLFMLKMLMDEYTILSCVTYDIKLHLAVLPLLSSLSRSLRCTFEVLVAIPMTRWLFRIVSCLAGGYASALCLKMIPVMRPVAVQCTMTHERSHELVVDIFRRITNVLVFNIIIIILAN